MSDKRIQQAHKFFQEGDYQRALDLYIKFLQDQPDDIAALHGSAICYAELQQTEEALKQIKKATSQSPKDISLLNSQANIVTRLGNIHEAIDIYKKIIQLKPEYAIAYNNLGKCYYHLQHCTSAERALLKAIELEPHYIDARYNLSLVYCYQQAFEKAKAQLNKILSLKKEHPGALAQLGEISMEQGQFKQAIEYFTQRLEQEPDNANSTHSLAQALLKLGKFEEAVQGFEQTLVLNPQHPEAHQELAHAYLQTGDTSKALSYYYRQLEVKPMTETYYNIGVLLMYQERNKEAIQYFQEALKNNPDDLPTHLNLAGIYLKAQQYEQALTHYEKAALLKPDDEEIKHIINAISQQQTPDKAPTQYLQNLFDQYAHYYDKHLTDFLSYQVPEKIAQMLFEETGLTEADWTLLDLGCGTGLSGRAVKSYAKTLIGIDVSPNMIEQAELKHCYDQLKVSDVIQALKTFKQNDLIMAADVFTYIGDLSEVIALSSKALNAEGLFVFSVEASHDGDYELQRTIRYAHHKDYLNRLLKENHFKVLRFDNIVLRKNKNQPINGYLVLARLTA